MEFKDDPLINIVINNLNHDVSFLSVLHGTKQNFTNFISKYHNQRHDGKIPEGLTEGFDNLIEYINKKLKKIKEHEKNKEKYISILKEIIILISSLSGFEKDPISDYKNEILSLKEKNKILNERINTYKEMVKEIKSKRCLNMD